MPCGGPLCLYGLALPVVRIDSSRKKLAGLDGIKPSRKSRNFGVTRAVQGLAGGRALATLTAPKVDGSHTPH